MLPVIAACFDLIPEHGDFLGKADKLLRRYLWSAFFTDRYENTAASRAFADYKALKTLLQNNDFTEADLAAVPVLNRTDFALATEDALVTVGWPKQMGIVARGILAVTTYLGARDFADNNIASFENDQHREYHHIFPDALLQEAGLKSYLALNCALITWKTNRSIGRKDPIDYLKDRVQWAGEQDVRERMKSHLIDFDLLQSASYATLEGPTLTSKLAADFDHFLQIRASRIRAAVLLLSEGKDVTIDQLMKAAISA